MDFVVFPGRLEELGYRYTLQPHEIWDHFDISYAKVTLFKCRVTLFKYNCTWERDNICQRVVAAVEAEVPYIQEALLVKDPPVKKKDFEVYPPISVMYEFFYGITLPEGPADAVLKEVLDTICSIDKNKIEFLKMLDEMFADHRLTYRICMRIKSIVHKLPLAWFQENDLLKLIRSSILSLTSKRVFSRSLTEVSEVIFQMFISNLARFMIINNLTVL